MIGWAFALCVASAPPAMVKIPAGEVRPFYRQLASGKRAAVEPKPARVETFWLDVVPVTRGQLLEFVRAHPQWRRSAVPRLLADEHYLESWKSDLELESAAAAPRPATEVSWFVARAYCQAKGLRLPTLLEWELALDDRGRDRPAVTRRILDWYQAPRSAHAVGAGPPNGFGVRDLVGLDWEWTLDFDTAPLGPDSRGAPGSSGLFCGSGGAEAIDPADQATFMRYAFRSSLAARDTTRDLGFRCARDDR